MNSFGVFSRVGLPEFRSSAMAIVGWLFQSRSGHWSHYQATGVNGAHDNIYWAIHSLSLTEPVIQFDPSFHSLRWDRLRQA